MINLYPIAGFTKQAHSAYMQRKKDQIFLYNYVFRIVTQTRELHPQMGLKKIWHLYEPDKLGRDHFIEIGCELGMALPKPRSYQRTTFSYKGAQYKNLAAKIDINDINLVWVSDITYFKIMDRHCYISLLMDVYSRRILGYNVADNMHAEESCKALLMALEVRQRHDLSRLIHHSDRGSQYVSKAYTDILEKHNIQISMCESVYENSHIERLNGIIKNEYLENQKIKSFSDLCRFVKKTVYNYNHNRPHWSINCLAPAEYEKQLTQIELCNRPILKLFSDKEINDANKNDQATMFI